MFQVHQENPCSTVTSMHVRTFRGMPYCNVWWKMRDTNHMYSAITFSVVSERLRLIRSESNDIFFKSKLLAQNFSFSSFVPLIRYKVGGFYSVICELLKQFTNIITVWKRKSRHGRGKLFCTRNHAWFLKNVHTYESKILCLVLTGFFQTSFFTCNVIR